MRPKAAELLIGPQPGQQIVRHRRNGVISRKTPIEIVEKLNKEINSILADPKTKERLADLGGTVLPGSPAEFGKLIIEETEKWAKVIKFAGIKAD